MSLRFTVLAFCLAFTLASIADAADKRLRPKKPEFELAYRGGPMVWFDDNAGLGLEVLQIAPGVYTSLGVFSVFYSYQVFRNLCFKYESFYCSGKTQQYGAYHRLIASKNGFHPWLGVGFSYYELDANGTGTVHYEADFIGEKDQPEGSKYKIAMSETGYTPFITLGAEYMMGDRLGLGIDMQPGLRFPLPKRTSERGASEPSELNYYLTVNTGIRVSYKIY